MLIPRRRGIAVLMSICLWTASLSAQDQGGETPAGGTDTGIGAPADLASFGDAEAAFSAVDRGDSVGSTGQTGQGFSALSAASPAGGLGGLGGLGGGFGGFGGGLGNLFGGMNTRGATSTRPALRTRLRSAVAVQARTPQRVGQVATQRFRSLSTQPRLRGINVNMQGKTAIISGVVRNDRDRHMSELLMRLEPGVRSVDNRVSVIPE